jgi:hypothetical protein
MSPGNPATKLLITRIAAKGSCAICSALKEFQTNLVKHPQPGRSVLGRAAEYLVAQRGIEI